MKRKRSKHIDKQGTLYLVHHRETGQTKIGCTSDLDRRLRSLQTGIPGTVTLIFNVWCYDRYRAEAIMARKYRQHKMLGEWYTFPDELSDDVLATMTSLQVGGSRA